MGRTIAIVILVVLTVCALKSVFQRAAVRTAEDQIAKVDGTTTSAAPSENNELDDVEVGSVIAGLPGESLGANLSGSVDLTDPKPVLQPDIAFEDVAGDSSDFTSLNNNAAAAGVDGMDEIPAVEAVIISEEENGQVVFETADPDEVGRRLDGLWRDRPVTATYDLLAMFRAELNADNKEAILSTCSLFPPDQNTRLILQMALSYPQPAEIRAQAAAFAGVQNLDLLLPHLSDPDSLVQLTIQRAFIPTMPSHQVIGARSEPEITTPAPARLN